MFKRVVTNNAGKNRSGAEFPVWELLDRARAKGNGSLVVDVIAPLASLLVLRWAAFMEAEQEAIASFNDSGFSPALPAVLQRQAWTDPERLSTYALDALASLARRDIPHIKYAAAVAPTLRESATRDPALVRQLASWVAQFPFDMADGREAAATAFDELLSHVVEAQGKLGGEFTTPRGVVELMVQLVDPQPGDRLYDPCFGVGGLLVASARRLRAAVTTESAKRWDDVRSNGIFGVEINSNSFAIGLCRVVLAGIERPGLELGDALERPLPRNRAVEGFDCILAAPPWGVRLSENRARHYPVPTGGIENLFLQHVMANLKPGGRAVIALPEGTLFRTGPDRQVRKTLLSEFRVEGVVSLPEGAFAPCTSIPSSLVVFRREPPSPDVRFVHVSAAAWPQSGSQRNWNGADGGAEFDFHDNGATGVAGDSSASSRSHTPVEVSRLIRDVSAIVRRRANPGDISVEAFRLIREISLKGHTQGEESAGIGGLDVWDVPIQTLAAREFELLAKRTGTELLETTLERLRAADPELKVVRLQEIADVVQGLSYDRALTTEHRSTEVGVPLIRVGDVVDPHVKRPTLFFSKEAMPRVREQHRLRRGDVLVTTSGTVGRIGLVDEPTIGAVAAKSVTVIRAHGGAVPEFLAAILRSLEYQHWLSGHARGATIQHLSVRTLRSLPLPLPSLPVQDAVIRSLTTGGDALGLLLRQVAGSTADPIAAWLESRAVVSLLSEKTPPRDPALLLSEIGAELQKLRSALWGVAKPAGVSKAVISWLMSMGDYGRGVAGIEVVPLGTARFAALELARRYLESAQEGVAADDSALAPRIRLVNAALTQLHDQVTAAMLGSLAVAFSAEPQQVLVGVPTEIRLRVRNESVSGLRNLRIQTQPNVGGGEIPYLAEGTHAELPLTVTGVSATEPFQLSVRWHARRLDGNPVDGQRSLPILVRSTRDAAKAADLGASPYIVGNPIDREEMFYGRAHVIDRIRRQLAAATNANVVLLEGNRRTGKTSVLKQLQKKETLPGWVIVYCNFQEAEGDPTRAGISTRDVYRFLARTIGWTLFGAGIRTWFPGQHPPDGKRPFQSDFLAARDRAITDEHPFETFELYLASALEAARPHRVLLMLDEFDKLQEGIDAGVTSPQVPENIRHILQHHHGLSAILTGSRRLKRLREEYWSALFGLGYRVGISSLPHEDAQRLVTEPVAGRLTYLAQARDRVVALCAAQPFLVQSLCNRIFEQAAGSGERVITMSAVEEAAVDMVRENEHFRTLWGYAQTHRRRLLLALCERLAEGPDAVTLDLLAAQLERAGVHVPRQTQVGDDLDYLRELELIEFDKGYRGGTYRIAIPLLGLWIRTSIDLDDATARAREEAPEADR